MPALRVPHLKQRNLRIKPRVQIIWHFFFLFNVNSHVTPHHVNFNLVKTFLFTFRIICINNLVKF